MLEKPYVRLENWGVTSHPHYPRTDPCLCGEMYGHPHFAPGERMTSSPIKELRGGLIVTRSGTFYELGKVDLNALSDAFAVNREFAYLMLLLCLVLTEDREIPLIPSPCASVPQSVFSIVAYAALALSNLKSTIQ